MRIVFVTETWHPSTDGVVTRITATLRELKRMGHELLVVAPRGGAPEFEGIPVRDVPNISVGFIYGGKPWGLPMPRVAHYIRQFNPDVVHVVNPFVIGWAGVLAAVAQRRPLVASYHTNIAQYADFYHLGFTKPAIWALLRALHNRADLNLATSEAVRQELIQQQIKNVRVWQRGVDLSLFHPSRRSAAMRQRLTGGQGDRPIALYVGRLALEKGLERLRVLFSVNPDLHLAFVGDGPARPDLERLFAETPTTFVGTLHGEQLAEAYASADVFVFPSTTDTLGLVLLEAMASGLPIVAAESRPTHELVDQSGAGLLFDPDHPETMGDILKTLMDSATREELSRRARQEAERWGWRVPTLQLVEWYYEIMGLQRGTA
ncbi:glycosyl transferase group 1 [Sulfobacillus acidophilus TPY]|uniref:Glycosyl transferase group 1 n=1 Tax=Sulfobacillus acidophilus (strain ATCC 700253 / DSM 10332 / NAL) TaxID=679936 RepID=G8TY17_SULAD|nr:glycosyl transferase group 1 [Sulfobacillus acidophilus TPY]AEW03924.1 glycosyl transferase group 1 [Sulfobacillus acidophilus DSM 10332]